MELMSGNEAIAQGAWEAGCTIGAAYPGTKVRIGDEVFRVHDLSRHCVITMIRDEIVMM